jgi:hypothetical protein
MSTYDDASLVLVPSGYKNGVVFSQKPMDANGQLTFTRASSATRVASNGLIEKVRTNVALHSNDFSNADWVKAALGVGLAPVVTANYTTDPFGGNNGWRLQCDLNGGTTTGDRSLLQQTIAGTTVPTTVSIYAKLNSAGTATFAGTNGSTDNVTITSTEWVRVSSVRTTAIGSYIFRVGLFGGVGQDNTLDISIAFAQLETGDIATDYIATTSAAVSVGPVSGLPRLDYLNSTCPKLLLEPQRTNLALFSEQFNNASWSTIGGITIDANAETAPDGTLSADRLSGVSIASNRRQQSVTLSNVQYTQSCYFKKDTSTLFWLALYSGTSAEFRVEISWTGIEPTISEITAGATAQIFNAGNGWYRISITYTIATSGSYSFAILPDRNALTQGIFAWGAQLEAGAYATSYIPTLGASVTRVADACSKTGISSLIGQTEGTVFLEITTTNDITTITPIGISDGTGSNRVLLYVGSGILTALVTVSGVAQATISSSAISANTSYKMAIAYKANDFAFYVNGALVGTDTNGTVPACSKFNYDNGSGSAPFYGLNNQALLFKTRLTNQQLQELTSL